jgi:Zn-dependent metalloprotease
LNVSRNIPNARVATAEQLSAIAGFKNAVNAPNMTVRWNDFGGSPDVMYDFASPSYGGTPEQAARAFLSQNTGLFGVSETNNIRHFNTTEALGGYLIRFNQTFNGIPVQNGGIGVVMNANKQVVMLSGPFFNGIDIDPTPTLTAAQARSAADAESRAICRQHTGRGRKSPSAGTEHSHGTSHPYRTTRTAARNLSDADGYKLIWKVAKFNHARRGGGVP